MAGEVAGVVRSNCCRAAAAAAGPVNHLLRASRRFIYRLPPPFPYLADAPGPATVCEMQLNVWSLLLYSYAAAINTVARVYSCKESSNNGNNRVRVNTDVGVQMKVKIIFINLAISS